MGAVRKGVEVAGFNYLIASNVVKNIMNEANIASKNVRGPVDEAFIQGLKYYYAKHYTAAKQKFEVCTGLFDYHWRAKALIRNCNSAIARGEDVPLPSVSLTIPATSLTLGESVTFTASVSGGNAPITYKWYLNDVEVSSGTSNSWKFTPTSEGTYTIYVVVVDADGCTAQSQTATLTVKPAPSFGGTWIILIILIAAALAVIVLIFAQKRRMRPAPTPTM
jgi:PKD repeat protein